MVEGRRRIQYVDDMIEEVRRSALNRSFVMLILAGSVGFLAGIVSKWMTGRYWAVLLYVVLFLVGIAMILARRLDYRLRAGAMVCSFVALGVAELAMFGVVSMADTYFVIGLIYATVFWPRRVGIGVTVVCLGLLVVFATLYLSGVIPITSSQQRVSQFTATWVSHFGILAFCCLIVYFVFNDYTDALEQRLTGEYEINEGLRAEAGERAKAEIALRESEERYRSLFDASDSAILLLRKNAIVDCNPQALAIFGGTRETILASAPAAFGPPLQADGSNTTQRAIQLIKGALGGSPQYFTWRFHRLEGGEFDAECVLASLHIFGKAHLLAIIRDITERVQAEKEQTRLREQLAQANKLESVGRLAGGIAHDFNNLLAVIMGHSETALQELSPDAAQFETFRQIHDAANRSAALTRQLLAFARKQSATPRVLNLNESVELTCRMLKRLIGESIDLQWKPGENVWPICIDPAQLDQILTNLVVNARDAVFAVPPGSGSIAVSTFNATVDNADLHLSDHAPGDYVVLCVTDSGAGMSKEVLEHIFEPFYSTKGVGQGTGLGLATVYGIVKQNGGFVVVYSEPSHGTAFKIYLPRTTEAALVETDASITAPARRMRGVETILLVEDELAILQLTHRMLERNGYTVLAAHSPVAALELAQGHEQTIDLLLTDVIMPEMHGRMLRDKVLLRYPDIKALFMSGYTADVIAQHGVLDPGVYFIEKPFSFKALFAKIREVLDTREV